MRAARPDTMVVLALALFALTLTATQASNFEVTNILVPRFVTPDQEDIEISCNYDGNFTLLNWFKGSNEFFRYKPGSAPSTRSFPILGVGKIEMIVCGPVNCRLRLGLLTEEASGLYRCDIEKVNAPYKYATRSAYMQVYGHQYRRPNVEGLAEEYGEGDEILAYCRASPTAEIRWYINGYEVIEMRGLVTLREKSTRLIFMGIPPKVCIQCAEFQFGNLLGSKEVKARWRSGTKKNEKAQKKCNNSASNIKNPNNWFWMYSVIIISKLLGIKIKKV